MNDFIVTINGKKEKLSVVNNHLVVNGNKEINVELSEINKHSYLLRIENKVYEVAVNRNGNDKYSFLLDGFYFETEVRTTLQEKAKELLSNREQAAHHDTIKAPMPGLILKVKKKVGDTVEMGESVVILEAMKMENEIRSPASGKIKEIVGKEGKSVEKGGIILSIE